MAYIDPEGMFHGDRMSLLSDEAKLYWPYFWCASNTVGRIELNHRKVINNAFGHFKVPPTERMFWVLAREYRDAFLLFIYKSKGQIWGQWDVSERYLPDYKTAADKRTPAPDHAEFAEWRNRYISSKTDDFSKSLSVNNSGVDPTNPPGRGNGSGKGIGEEKEEPAPPVIPFRTKPGKRTLGWRRFEREYPGEVKPDWDCQIYMSVIVTDEDEEALFANVELWKSSKKWQDGFVPSAENYLRKGQWRHPPKPPANREPEYPKVMI